MRRSFAIRALAVLVSGVFASRAAAQTVRGTVVDAGGRPVPGVVALLLDSTSAAVSRALSNERGEFRLAAPRAGSYRVRTMRIGYRPAQSDPFQLLLGGESSQRFVLSGVQFALDTVRVVDRSTCRVDADSAAATFTVWEQARTALTAVATTAGERAINATTIAYDRMLDRAGRRVKEQQVSVSSGYVAQPWRSLSPDALHRGGYIAMGSGATDDSTTYFAPGLDALLSPHFVEDHCFHLVSSKDASRIGIAFEPNRERSRVPEIQGTLWLDRKSAELRALDYTYANVPRTLQAAGTPPGGSMEFARMTNGAWAISRWNIRMPAFALERTTAGTVAPVVAAVRETGGELALARRGTDTLWARPPQVMRGVITDSASGNAIANARVSLAGTLLEAVSDAAGRFAIAGVLPGEYTLDVRTPSLDSARAMTQQVVTFADTAALVHVRAPSAAQIVATVCARTRLGPDEGIILGSVSSPRDTAPPANVEIVAEWNEIALRSGGTANLRRTVSGKTNAEGTFRLCGIPVNTPLLVRAASASASASLDLRIPAGARFTRAELTLDRPAGATATLAGTVYADSSRTPIVGAEVTLPSAGRSALSNEKGEFRFDAVPAGPQRLVVRRLGYGALDTEVNLPANRTTDRTVYLSRAVTLDSVRVNAIAVDPLLRAFDENRKLGLGHFFGRAELAKLEGQKLGTIISQLPGSYVVRGNNGGMWVGSSRGRQSMSNQKCARMENADTVTQARYGCSTCWAMVYLDRFVIGKPGDEVPNLSRYNAEDIEAIEYYASGAQTPAEYNNLDSNCGVLVIHTRRSP